MIETEKTNYGNWIPRTFMTLCYSAVALLLAIELGLFFASVGTVVLWLVGVVLLLALLFTLYMQVCRWLFSFTGRGLMGKFHEYLLAQLRKEGISEIHYIANVEKQPFMPAFLRTPWMMYGVGLIYGKK